MKISNISCFVRYKVISAQRTCVLNIYSRLRPGYVETVLTNIDVKNFDIKKELSTIKLQVQADWNGTLGMAFSR